MKKLKVAYLVSTLGRTGPTRQLYNLIKYLDHGTIQIHVITLSKNPIHNLEEDFLDLGIDIHHLKLSRLNTFLVASSRVKQLLLSLDIDVLHSQGIRADWINSRLDGLVKSITTQRNVSIFLNLAMYYISRNN